MRRISAIVMLALLAACGPTQVTVQPVESVLRNGNGDDVGRVTLREQGERVQVRVRVNGLPAGLHGMHLHEGGRCEGPAFQSAGGHLNPGGLKHHGHQNPQGPHLGDLGSIRVGADGRADVTVEVAVVGARTALRSLLGLGQNGLALVIHAAQDDEMTDPSGNSGARIRCAEIHP